MNLINRLSDREISTTLLPDGTPGDEEFLAAVQQQIERNPFAQVTIEDGKIKIIFAREEDTQEPS